jgi:methylmalonyl-CoA mutase cobalamin-binding subunit
MNLLEKKMFDMLINLRDNFAVKGIKAEFEAEGTRIDELLRLVDLVKKANLKLGIKIGGCEAIKDLMEVKQIGTDYVIAPMIETEYALKKFIDSKNKIFDEYEKNTCNFLINIETIQGFKNLEKIVEVNNSYKNNGLKGIVFGRVDFSLSYGLSREDIDSLDVTKYVIEVAKACKNNNLELVVGGGISLDSINVLREIKKIHLTRFETRKVIFSKDSLEIKNLDQGLIQAVHFELLWLENKKAYYGSIFREDDKRIEMLSKRWVTK